MLRLIIALCFLSVLRANGQSTVVSFVVESQTLPLSKESKTATEDPPPPPQPVIKLHPKPDSTINLSAEHHVAEGSGHSLLRPTVTFETKPLFLNVTTDTMAQPKQNSIPDSDDSSKIIFRDDDAEESPPHWEAGPEEVTKATTTNGTKPVKPVNELNVTEVEVGERSSFDGDTCPAGYVKVNGKCVLKDD